MNIAYFDAISGAAGDMILGALLDAGLSLDLLQGELAKLPLDGYRLRCERVRKQHIAATQFRVDLEREDLHHHGREPGHGDTGGRPLHTIEDLIAGSGLADRVKQVSLQIFHRLGEAEAKVHGVSIDEVHFHEVGAVDSIVDVVGAAAALDLLGLDEVYCSPLPLGSGTIRTRHGLYPIPAPATLELLATAQAPTVPSAQNAEQVTPTGAAILTCVAVFDRPPMTVDRVGYGSGEADLSIPNVLRVLLGRRTSMTREDVTVLETNIDDMNPQIHGHVLDRLFAAGALDALLVPAIMKKGRPGVKLEVLCRPPDAERVRETLFRETSTLGVRSWTSDRYALERDMEHVSTPYGVVAVKVKRRDGRAVAAAPEYEDCRRLALERDIPLVEIYGAALAAGRALLEGHVQQ